MIVITHFWFNLFYLRLNHEAITITIVIICSSRMQSIIRRRIYYIDIGIAYLMHTCHKWHLLCFWNVDNRFRLRMFFSLGYTWHYLAFRQPSHDLRLLKLMFKEAATRCSKELFSIIYKYHCITLWSMILQRYKKSICVKTASNFVKSTTYPNKVLTKNVWQNLLICHIFVIWKHV